MFLAILDTFCLKQHVTETTHNKCHTLDLIIRSLSDDLIKNVDVTCVTVIITGYNAVFWALRLSLLERAYPTSNIYQFQSGIKASSLANLESLKSMDEAFSSYNKALSQVMDKCAPVIPKTFIIHPATPYYKAEISEAINERKKQKDCGENLN